MVGKARTPCNPISPPAREFFDVSHRLARGIRDLTRANHVSPFGKVRAVSSVCQNNLPFGESIDDRQGSRSLISRTAKQVYTLERRKSNLHKRPQRTRRPIRNWASVTAPLCLRNGPAKHAKKTPNVMTGVGLEAHVTSRDPTLDAVGTRSCAIRRGMSKKRATAIFDPARPALHVSTLLFAAFANALLRSRS
jgi:hypothetical protein